MTTGDQSTPGIFTGDRERALHEVNETAARAASGLAALGLGEGDTLALLLRNDIAFFEASLAAGMIGAYPVPINWHNTAEEVCYIVEDSGAKALVVHADLLHSLASSLPEGLPVLVVETPPEIRSAYGLPSGNCAVPPGMPDWEVWTRSYSRINLPPPALRSSMFYTSGTTGKPKGVRRQPMSPDTAPQREKVMATVFGIRPGMRTIVTGTLYHSAPNAHSLAAVRIGARIVLQPRFDAEELLALIERHRITHMHIVPIMFVRLLRLPADVRSRHDLSSLEWVIHGAAPCPPEAKRAMIAWWGPVIYEYYGSTEAGLNTCASSEDWLTRPGTVGRPAFGSSVRIVDGHGLHLPPGEEGLVYLKQEAISDFTYHGMDAKRREMELDGYVTVGDIGCLDEDGFLFIRDRKIDMVISGGVNIYPAEIEGVLMHMKGVRDCAVFGIPDEEYGESLAACIQPENPDPGENGGLDAERVRAYLGEHLAPFKVPKVVEIREDLPREDSGKIFKRKLRAPYWEKAGRQI